MNQSDKIINDDYNHTSIILWLAVQEIDIIYNITEKS